MVAWEAYGRPKTPPPSTMASTSPRPQTYTPRFPETAKGEVPRFRIH
jgi:hypothetical protein